MLLDKYLPKYTYKEYHDISVSGSREKAYAAARNLDFSESKIIKVLFTLRGLPTSDLTLEGFSNLSHFTLLEEIPNEEFIIGFWANTKIEKIHDRERFIIDDESKRLKAAWNFKVDGMDDGRVLVSTETRVYCIAMITKIFFSMYWAIIKPFSGLIRREMLRIIKENAEKTAGA